MDSWKSSIKINPWPASWKKKPALNLMGFPFRAILCFRALPISTNSIFLKQTAKWIQSKIENFPTLLRPRPIFISVPYCGPTSIKDWMWSSTCRFLGPHAVTIVQWEGNGARGCIYLDSWTNNSIFPYDSGALSLHSLWGESQKENLRFEVFISGKCCLRLVFVSGWNIRLALIWFWWLPTGILKETNIPQRCQPVSMFWAFFSTHHVKARERKNTTKEMLYRQSTENHSKYPERNYLNVNREHEWWAIGSDFSLHEMHNDVCFPSADYLLCIQQCFRIISISCLMRIALTQERLDLKSSPATKWVLKVVERARNNSSKSSFHFIY